MCIVLPRCIYKQTHFDRAQRSKMTSVKNRGTRKENCERTNNKMEVMVVENYWQLTRHKCIKQFYVLAVIMTYDWPAPKYEVQLLLFYEYRGKWVEMAIFCYTFFQLTDSRAVCTFTVEYRCYLNFLQTSYDSYKQKACFDSDMVCNYL